MTALEKIYAASKMLFNSMPFYGILSLRVRKVVDKTVSTACIRRGEDRFSLEMAFNPEWMEVLPVEHISWIIEHELSHMINGHLHDQMYINKGVIHELMNVAMDCEINQYLPKQRMPLPDKKYLPGGVITLEGLSKQLGLTLPEKAGSMTYYDLLKKKFGEKYLTINPDGTITNGHGDIIGTIDQHSILEDAAEQSIIEGMVESAAQETEKRRGTVPGAAKSLLDKMYEKRKPVIDWKSFLRRFVQNSYKEYCVTTRRRESRRFDGSPGIRHEPEFSLLVGIDSSGSVSNDELKEFLSEIDIIHRTKCDIRILVCDTRIVQDFTYRGKKETIEIHGRGGTSFEPVLDAYEKSKSTCLVYMTDGECCLERKLKKPVLWILSSRGTDHYLKDCKTVKITKK